MSEYGITVRWDKNFLTMVQLMLTRRKRFRAYGGIRFGGTLTIEDAWSYGFDHIAIATGAGRPTIVPMKNNLIRGIRQASDFLMALQLTGAFKKDTLSNLQVRLPAVVIGGGLTGIDTATELFAYYPVQVEKMLAKYEQVAAEIRRAIAEGEAKPGERLPPAKDLAAVLGVNTNTVLRSLRLLRDEGLLEFRRGRGISVAGTPERGAVVQRARELVDFARQQGYRTDELIAIIEQVG